MVGLENSEKREMFGDKSKSCRKYFSVFWQAVLTWAEFTCKPPSKVIVAALQA